MKGKWTILIIAASLILTGCDKCLRSFYGVHEEPKYYEIRFNAPAIKPAQLLEYLDHEPAADTATYSVYKSFKGVNMDASSRIIHFKKAPEEFYWLSADQSPCNIIAIRNHGRDSSWTFTLERLDPVEATRIGLRFSKAVLYPLDSTTEFNLGPGSR